MRPKPLAVEYSLSKLGRIIIRPLRGMCRWAQRHHTAVSADVHRVEAGQPAVNGKRIGPEDTRRYTHVPDCASRAGTGKLDGETRRRRDICARYALQAQQ
jgi:hypothetical protein